MPDAGWLAVVANPASVGVPGTAAMVTGRPTSAFSAGLIDAPEMADKTLPCSAKGAAVSLDTMSRSSSVMRLWLSNSKSMLSRLSLPMRVKVVSNSLRLKPPSWGSARSVSTLNDAKLSLRMKFTTRWSGRNPYFSASSSGKIWTRRIASGGRSRNSRKLPMRWPLSRMTGGPPAPRPRPLPACGATAVRISATEDAPSPSISSADSSSMGGTSVSTEPRIRSAVTTISCAGFSSALGGIASATLVSADA